MVEARDVPHEKKQRFGSLREVTSISTSLGQVILTWTNTRFSCNQITRRDEEKSNEVKPPLFYIYIYIYRATFSPHSCRNGPSIAPPSDNCGSSAQPLNALLLFVDSRHSPRTEVFRMFVGGRVLFSAHVAER